MEPNSFIDYVKKAPKGRLFYSASLSWLALAIFLCSWLAPTHYLPWAVFENEFLSFLSLALALLALQIKERAQIELNKYYFISIFILLIIFFQYCGGMISGQVAALGCLYVTGFGLSTVAGQSYRIWLKDSGIKLQAWILLPVLFVILVSACIVLAQWVRVEHEFPSWMALSDGGRPFGNLGQPNNQGTLLVVGLILVDLLWKKRLLNILACLFFQILLSCAIAMTASRTSMLSVVLSGMYLLFVNTKARDGLFTCSWLVSVPVLYIAVPQLKAILLSANDIVSPRGLDTLSESPRIAIYFQLLKAIAVEPLHGFGWMQTAYAQSISAINNYVGYETSYSHNLFIDLILWFGLPVALMLSVSLTYVIRKDYESTPKNSRIFFAIFIPLVVHSALEFPFAYAYFLFPAGFLLGYIQPGPAVSLSRSKVGRLTTTALYYLVGVGGIVLGVLVAVDYMRLAEDFRILRFNSKNIGKVPDGFLMTEPMVLVDMRNAFDVFVYKPSPNVSQVILKKIEYAALREHWPSAHVKLISQLLIINDFEGARQQYIMFKNIYNPSIVSWGARGLEDAFCRDDRRVVGVNRFCEMI